MLSGLNTQNDQGEYYLTDIMGILRNDGKRVAVFKIDNADEVMGINDRDQLALAERMMKGDR